MQTGIRVESARVLPAEVASKEGVLREVAHLAAGASGLPEPDLLKALALREQVGTTAFGGGIALPHCHIRGLPEFVLGVLAAPHGVDFDAVDGQPVGVFVFILAPAERRNEHIALLASVSRVLNNSDAVEQLRHSDEGQLLSRFRTWWSPPKGDLESGQKSLLQVFVQRDALVPAIVEVLSEAIPGHISVMDARNARTYLHRLPLFAGFWTETEEQDTRVVTAVVDARKCNDITRRIMLLTGDADSPGVLVSAVDLSFAVGRLDL